MKLRDYFYVDPDLLLMYFAQLPPAHRLKFRKEYRVDIDLELSLNPKLATKRQRPQLPDSIPISLAEFVGGWLEANEDTGDPQSLTGDFVAGQFEVRYTRVPLQDGPSVFVAFPAEGSRKRLAQSGDTYVILGDTSNCNHQWNRPASTHSDASALERLQWLWDDVNSHRQKDARGIEEQSSYAGFLYGRADIFRGLINIERGAWRRLMPARFSGICRVRGWFRSDDEPKFCVSGTDPGQLCALYPLFLTRMTGDERQHTAAPLKR
jgi:hypothetical protein